MTINFKNRFLSQLLPDAQAKNIVLVTGARQTGKTTLAKHYYPKLRYINLDALENRSKITQVSAEAWAKTIGKSVIDEAQKSPQLFEKIKYAYDDDKLDFTVLLGSSQILLLRKIRETLAGRIKIYELFPLMAAELQNDSLQPPLLNQLLNATSAIEWNNILNQFPEILFDQTAQEKQAAQQHLLTWGGMPNLLAIPENQRFKWLKDYEYTYLERDLADLTRLSDLQPFQTFQKLAALRSAQLLNYSELARDSQISVDTAKRYLEYLKLSYQVILLTPFHNNRTTGLVKTPKIYWLDIGLLRYLAGFRGEITGEIFETFVISEIVKWVRTMQEETELYFYRTHAGSEIDLILQTPYGLIAVEIKSRKQIVPKDYRLLQTFSQEFNDVWLGGLVIYNGEKITKLHQNNIWALPAWRLLTA